MPCFCKLLASRAATTLSGLELGAGFTRPRGLVNFAAQLGKAANLSAGDSSAASGLSPPRLSLSSSAMASMSAAASLSASLNAGLGIDPLAPGAAIALEASINSLNANAGAMAPLLALDPGALLGLSDTALAVAKIRATLGIDPLIVSGEEIADAASSFAAGLRVSAPPTPAFSASISAMASYAFVAKLGAALGIDMSQGGAAGSLRSSLSATSSLIRPSLPKLQINKPKLGKLLGLLGALVNIKQELGADLTQPGAMSRLRLSLAPLTVSAFPVLDLPAPGFDSAALDAAAKMDHADVVAQNFGQTVTSSPLRLGGLLPAVMLAVQARAALGFDLTAATPCGSGCPIG